MMFGQPVHGTIQCQRSIDMHKRSSPWLNSRRVRLLMRRGFVPMQCMRRAILEIGGESLCKQHSLSKTRRPSKEAAP